MSSFLKPHLHLLPGDWSDLKATPRISRSALLDRAGGQHSTYRGNPGKLTMGRYQAVWHRAQDRKVGVIRGCVMMPSRHQAVVQTNYTFAKPFPAGTAEKMPVFMGHQIERTGRRLPTTAKYGAGRYEDGGTTLTQATHKDEETYSSTSK
ncbi:hypothetical protein Bbelb_324700 [Branchiostoma belcheri]|nr:hypothetical protein Bbelb_324700 [Branchiostoma belcheri]